MKKRKPQFPDDDDEEDQDVLIAAGVPRKRLIR
jgi:hypothetical protein